MTSPENKSSALFGQAGHSSVWAVDFPVQPADGETFCFDLPGEHLLAIYQLKGKFGLNDGHGFGGKFEASRVVFAKTGTRGGTLAMDSGFSGLLIGLSAATIRTALDSHRPGLDPGLRDLVFGSSHHGPFCKPIPSHSIEKWIPEMRNAPVAGAAAEFWYEAKVREFIARDCFHDRQPRDRFFCSRQKMLAMDKVSQVKSYLAEHIDTNLNLEVLASHVGCSRHYLSRTFSKFTGTTISQYLRHLRIEQAATLLAAGDLNVGEIADKVGYHSSSHFSKAFFHEKGCLPSKYNHLAA